MDDQNTFLKLLLLLTILIRNGNASDFTTDKLYYRNQNLTDVPSELSSTKNANDITKAIFSHNNFDVLKLSDFVYFSKFPNLKYIFFDHNNITYIESYTFGQIHKMKFLDLSHNGLDVVSDELYDDLKKLKFLHYINLKRNPIKNFKNIDKLIAKGIQVEYDGISGRQKKLKFRSRRVISDGSSISDMSDNLSINDKYSHTEQKEIVDNVKLDADNGEIAEYNNSDEERNSTTEYDKPVKAYVVDQKLDQINTGNARVHNNFLGSIIFNFLAAFLVLVALPIAMVIYYFVHRNDGIS